MAEIGERASSSPSTESAGRANERRTLAVACGAHAIHDGYTDLVYVMLPIWQAEFGLAYSAVGMLRGLFSGTMAAFQIPASFVADRIGTATLLAIGTALAGFGYVVAGMSSGLALLAAALFIGGLGASTQHPLASALVAHAFSGKRSLKALGSYNFAGDVGKMLFPAIGAFLIAIMPWRPAVATLGLCGFAAAIVILMLTPRVKRDDPAPADGGDAVASEAPPPRFGFPLLLSIGVLDSATRMGFLTYLPFLLTAKGASVQAVGLALTAVFAGGACGKLVCAFVGARIGVFATVLLTELLTAVAIFALLPLSLIGCYALLPLVGIALNGTSSVLYGSVPLTVTRERRTRAFSIFYTGTIGSGAVSPILYGFVGDAIGVPMTLAVVAAIVLMTLPLAVALRPALPR